MKKNLFYCITSFLFLQTFMGQVTLPKAIKQESSQKISFTENKGQVSDQNFKPRTDVLYSGTDGKMVFHIKKNGISYQLNRIESYREETDPKTKQKYTVIDKNTIYRVDTYWKNCNPNLTKKNDVALPGASNYYLESCPNGVRNVKSYTGFTLKDLYANIDLHYYQNEGKLKCDYIVAAGADHKQIQIEIKGAKIKLQENGNLIFTTPLGDIEEGAPIVFQNGKKLVAKWIINGNILSFQINNFNKSLPLVIDPATRVWGTYLGGTSTDNGLSCSTDASGNVYLSGSTQSGGGTVIATVGSQQSTYASGLDGFLEKFDANGQRLWGTYYGSGFNDYGTSCATDLSGNVYMAGYTALSGTFLATPGSHQPTYGGGNLDAFLVKFDASGVRLWGTYYGGTNNDWGYSVVTDAAGNVYMAGTTTSTGNVMWTSNGWSSYSGISNAYLVKFNSAGVRQWGTCYGIVQEEGYSCAVDISGNVYLAGYATASTNISTPGSHQPNKNAGDDGFLVKFNSSCIRQWATYYGGSLNDYPYCVTTFSNNAVYLAGYTESNGGAIAGGPFSYQFTNGGGASDGYLAKFNTSGVRQWGTFYGGTGADFIASCTTDPSGNVYAAGTTSSTGSSIISTTGSHQINFGGGTSDAFAAKFSTAGPRQWGTYYGGSGVDRGNCCAMNSTGNLFLAGNTDSGTGTVIATAGTHQSTIGGLTDAFLVDFDVCVNGLNATSSPSVMCSGDNVIITATGADSYTWLPSTNNSSTFAITPTNTFTYTLVGAALGCTQTIANYTFVVNPLPTITVNSGTTCMGQAYTLTPSGALTYTYTGGGPIVSPTISSTYTVTGTDGNGCISNPGAISTVTVIAPSITVNSGSICSGQTFTMNPSGAISYTYTGGNPIVSPSITTSYTVTGTDAIGCVNFIGTVSTVTVGAIPIITVNSGAICTGQSFTMTPGGASTYTYSSGNAVVSPTTNSTYTVIGTSSLGCLSSSFATSNVTVNIRPVISVSGGSLCSGQSFTINPSGANTYTFSGGNAVVSPMVNTSYSVTGTNTLGCPSLAPAICNLTVLPSPTLTVATNNSTICLGAGGSATLTANGANSYAWSTGGTNSNEVVSPTVTTTYSVTGTDANGCQTMLTFTQFVDACNGLKVATINDFEFKLFPNPNNGEFTINLGRVSENTLIEVFNSIGQLVLKDKINNAETVVNLSSKAKGIYFVRVWEDNKIVAQQKVVKQ